VKAFHLTVDGFDPMVACADTLPKARYVAFKAAQESGYTSVTFARISGRHAPEFDAWAAKQPKPRLVAESYARWEAR
jgi:hypothetical protein